MMEGSMKYRGLVIFAFLISALASAQEQGIIECRDQTGIPAWEKPGSLFVARQLACGQTVATAGVDRGYVIIKMNERIAGYVEAKYVRLLQRDESTTGQRENQAQQAVPPAIRPAPESQPKSSKYLPPRVPTIREGIRIHRSEIGVEFSHIAYGEPSLDMQEKGIMGGVSGSYALFPKHYVIRLEGIFSLGSVDYVSPSGRFDKISDYHFEPRISAGRDFSLSEKVYFTPFVGFGYRFLYDDLGYVSGGYDRKSNYLYSPAGLGIMLRLGNGWFLGAAGEYDYLWHGWQYSRLSDYASGIDTLVNAQKKGWGARGSLQCIKKVSRFDFSAEPFIRYWKIDQSNIADIIYYGEPIGTGWEPANTSTEWGAKLGVRF
jgi:hypothetical protein